MGMFTREDLMLAKSVDLKAVAASLGYLPLVMLIAAGQTH